MKLPSPPPIYLDNHATTPVDPRVAAVVLETMTSSFGNANSVEHLFGEAAAELVADARQSVARLLGAVPEGVHFTSGASEAIELAIAHAVASRKSRRLRVALTTVEHAAVLDAVAQYERQDEIVVRWLPVDDRARLDMAAFEDACRGGVDLVCVMAANNEVGTVNPIQQVAQIAGQTGASTLVDATQAAGAVPLEAEAWGITYLSVSAHKIYGPKGVGALVVPPALNLRQSRGSTPGTGSGTPNVPGIAGFGEACRLRYLEARDNEQTIGDRRNRLQALLLATIPDLLINGDLEQRLSNNLHVSTPGVPNDAVIARLRRHVALSSGAACSSGAQTPSHVLRAMGLSEEIREGALRMGLSKFTTDEDVRLAADYIAEAVAAVRRVIDA